MERPFKSFLANDMESFITRKKAENSWSNTYYENLHYFDNYICSHYPESTELTQEMMDWCKPRPTENGNSCRYRTTVIWNFVSYLRCRGKTNISILRCYANVPVEFVPHFFSKDELLRFFKECDIYWYKRYKNQHSLHRLINMLELPVFFRFLFSTGVRTCEARELKRKDIDLLTGVVNIDKSKGVDKHRVALHESILKLLCQYDDAIGKVFPDRVYFFPAAGDKPHRAAWEGYHFRKLWSRISSEPARPYDFRHHYATTNISKWENHGFEFSGKLLFLSRSMGHKNMQSTFGYFHLTPMLTDKLRNTCEKALDELLPPIIDKKTRRFIENDEKET